MDSNHIYLSTGEGDILLHISVNGKPQSISFDTLKEIWHDLSDATPQDVEYFHADVSGHYVICCAYVSQGQGGIVFIWDTDTQKIIHYSDGKFALTAAIHNNNVYVLRDVHYWGVKPHLELDYCDFGIMSEDNDVTPIELDEETANSFSDSFVEYSITFDNNNSPVITKKSKE